MSLYGWHPAAPRKPFPVQRTVSVLLAARWGIQCQERRSDMPCKGADR